MDVNEFEIGEKFKYKVTPTLVGSTHSIRYESAYMPESQFSLLGPDMILPGKY